MAWRRRTVQPTVLAKYVGCNIEGLLWNHCFIGRASSITQPDCICVALGTQHGMRMRHTVICDLHHYTILFNIFPQTARFIKSHRIQNCVLIVLIFSTTFVWNISHSTKNWARCDKNVYWSCCKVPFILVLFYWHLIFLGKFSKYPQISNLMKIQPMGADVFHADGQSRRI
jgi:hypothetical protein